MFEESVYEESAFDESAPAEATEVIEAWAVPAGARRARVIKAALLSALEHGYADPEMLADMAIGPLVEALAQVEVELADARRRIDELERASAGARRAWDDRPESR